MRFFIDASVLYSMVSSSKGAASELIRLAEEGVIELATSDYAFDEAARSLAAKDEDAAKKFPVLRAQRFWRRSQYDREGVIAAREIVADPFDAPIIAAAKQARPDALISFDRKHLHTKAVEKFIGAPVITAGDALALIRAQKK